MTQPPIPPARLTPEQLEMAASCAPTAPQHYSLSDRIVTFDFPAMLRQAATDARTLERLRAWLREGNTLESNVSWHIAKRVLAELDRLEREA